MRKNKLIALIGTLTMAAAGLAAVGVVSVSREKAVETSAADGIDIYFTKNNSGLSDYAQWGNVTPKIHYWGSSGTSWPGMDMTYAFQDSNNDAVYKYTVPSGTTGIIFNNGGNFQTTDVTSISNNKGFYLKNDSWWDGGQSKRFFNWESFDVKPYTINYYGNGNTSGSMSSTNAYANVSWGLTENAFVKTNYIFNGWNTKSDGSGTAYSDKALIAKDAFSAGSVLNLYAQWLKDMPNGVYLGGPWGWGRNAAEMSDNPSTANEKMITVSLDANDGVKAVEYNNNVEQYHGASAEPTVESEAAADGYTATGHGNDNSVVNKEGIYTVYINKSTWTYHFKPLRIKYDSNGGSGSMSSTYATADGNATVSANIFTKSGNQFVKWNTQANGQGTSYYADNVINTFLTSGENVTLYAQWEAVAQTYSVSYLENTTDEVTNMPSTETGLPSGSHTLSSQTPRRANFQFVGWNTNSSATTGITSVTITNSNINVYAIWRNNVPSDGYYVEINSSTRQALTLKQGSSTEYEGSFTLAKDDQFVIAKYVDESAQTWGYQDLQGQEGTARAKGQLVEGANDAIKAAAPGTYTVAFHTDYGSGRTYIAALPDLYTITIDGVSQPLVAHEGNEIKTATAVDVKAGDVLVVYNNGLLQTMNPKFVSNNNCKSVEGVSTVVVDGTGTIYVDIVNKTIFVGGFDAGTFYMAVTDNAGVDYVKLNKNATPQSDCDEYLTQGEYPFTKDDVISYINTGSNDGHIVPFDVATVDPASLNTNFDTSGSKIICTQTTNSFAYLKLGKDDKQGQNSVYFGNVDVQLAVDFAKTFVSKLGATCTPGTGQDYGWKDQIGTDWGDEATAFAAIENADAKNLLTNASSSSSYEDLAKFAELYNYIYGKYHATHSVITDFAGRNPQVNSGSRLVNISDVSTSTWIIAATAFIGISAVGVFFIYRKRKEN